MLPRKAFIGYHNDDDDNIDVLPMITKAYVIHLSPRERLMEKGELKSVLKALAKVYSVIIINDPAIVIAHALYHHPYALYI